MHRFPHNLRPIISSNRATRRLETNYFTPYINLITTLNITFSKQAPQAHFHGGGENTAEGEEHETVA